MPMSELDSKKAMEQRLSRRQKIAWLIFLLILVPFMLGIAYFAIDKIQSGDSSGGYNQKWQYIDPLTQLIVAIAYLCYVARKVFALFRSGFDKGD